VGAMVEDGNFRVEKFNAQNYQLWKMKMEYYLYHKDIFLPLDGIEKKLKAMKDEEWEVLDRKGIRNDTVEPGSVGGFQYFERKDNEGANGRIG
jgi:hypothetical protein